VLLPALRALRPGCSHPPARRRSAFALAQPAPSGRPRGRPGGRQNPMSRPASSPSTTGRYSNSRQPNLSRSNQDRPGQSYVPFTAHFEDAEWRACGPTSRKNRSRGRTRQRSERPRARCADLGGFLGRKGDERREGEKGFPIPLPKENRARPLCGPGFVRPLCCGYSISTSRAVKFVPERVPLALTIVRSGVSIPKN
jgi:hypothetical protein